MVQGIVDKDKSKQGKIWENHILIESPEILMKINFDYVLISVKNYEEIVKECLNMGVNKDQIIVFWEPDGNMPYIDKRKGIYELEREIKKYKCRLENLPYELGLGNIPKINSSVHLLKRVIQDKVSVCRFGDGELELMRGNERPWFQSMNKKLSVRLKDIFYSRESNIIIALANNFGNLDCYTDDAADEIREYLYGNTRKEIMKYIDMKYIYYDAYVSRPYILYKDKNRAKIIFDLYKQIWNYRNVLIVEGKYARTGIGNDLFLGTGEVKRIICPGMNAFQKYEEILNAIYKNIAKDDLVLISLGPTATVLAYDLAKNGIQAFDIGQLDNEYHWFLSKAEKKIEIPGKSVAEVEGCHCPKDLVADKKYEKQIVEQITD